MFCRRRRLRRRYRYALMVLCATFSPPLFHRSLFC